MKNVKTQALALIMTSALIFGVTGCSFSINFGSGKKFNQASKKMINAAQTACDAEKANSKQRKAIMKGNTANEDFSDGAYYNFTTSEAKSYELQIQSSEAGDMDRATLFIKNDSNNNQIGALIVEVDDEELAHDYFEDYIEYSEVEAFSSERLEQLEAQCSDFEWAIDDSSDDEYIAILSSEELDGCQAVYCKVDGKVFTYIFVSAEVSSDMYDEFFDFLEEADYPDLRDALDD